MEQLKEREKQILSYMQNEIKTKGYPPTVREMCQFLGIKSTSTAHKDLANLEKKGYIRKDPSKPRAIEILYQNQAVDYASAPIPVQKKSPLLNLEQPVERMDVSEIPVIGRIAAGTPILADENIEDTFPIPNRFLSSGNNFMLTVRGESMIEAGIFDGDYILVKQQNIASNGDIIVAMVDGFESEATVKTFYRENDHIRLQPENQTMSPILVKDVKILGLVKGVFRYLR
ncbi:transcriptional repressor LexA [Sinanaerobacter sp. ZZT-01]|uniref:transcriptional repressor LexA n=1 Tax=Sinanaerobacter sp. ZZT-01 TaxID=3111540 RepID=UPI002D77DDE4|nr:transcriptional repressor LexA [Sinanaerobacter sp. ZZT-01]WRR92596.1 transcriptional repressor LexA [Sinanaerobacter sp. ZZT-01]